MKTTQTMIQPMPTGRPAIEIARECYNKWQGTITLEEDLREYLQTGLVWARPDVFMMAKVIYFQDEQHAAEPVWYVRVAVGSLKELAQLLPLFLPKICFCRRGDPQLKVYNMNRFLKLAYRRKGMK